MLVSDKEEALSLETLKVAINFFHSTPTHSLHQTLQGGPQDWRAESMTTPMFLLQNLKLADKNVSILFLSFSPSLISPLHYIFL